MAEWIGDAARRGIREFTEARVVSEEVPAASFSKMLDFLERTRGKKRAAMEAGVGVSTWNHWRKGRAPSAANLKKIKTQYDDRRRPAVVKLRRTLAAKKQLKNVRMQISGTARISDRQSFRRNFAEEDLRDLDLTGAWDDRNDPAELEGFFTIAIQEATGIDVTWPEPDVTIILMA